MAAWPRDTRQWQPRGRRWLWVDIVAGLTVWALLIPEGLAYATLAGMPPATLFATAPIALLVYAVLGSSRRMIVSVSSAVATMSAATVSALGVAPLSARWIELTVELALLTGVLALLAGILRLGFVAEFISAPVQTRLSNKRRFSPLSLGADTHLPPTLNRSWNVSAHRVT